MNQLGQKLGEYLGRVNEISELEKALAHKRQTHQALSRQDFGVADGDPINVMLIVQCVEKVIKLQRQPTLGVV